MKPAVQSEPGVRACVRIGVGKLDLDVTADALRGTLLHWDSGASAWRPADDQ
jgi:hypothetical protein